jgi:hypothetical protein
MSEPVIPKDDLGYPIAGWEELLDRANAAEAKVAEQAGVIADLKSQRALNVPYFQCVCGSKAMPLTDDTKCDCRDIYEQEWTRIEVDPCEQAATIERLTAAIKKMEKPLRWIADRECANEEECAELASAALSKQAHP